MAESENSRSAGPGPLVREEASRPRTPPAFAEAPPACPLEPRRRRAAFFSILLLVAGCGPSGVTLLKPSNLVDYQYVTCFPHKDDPGALDACIHYYEERGFVRQDQVNVLQM